MKVLGIGHPSYRVSDREKAIEFYRDVLGLKVKFTIGYDEFYEFQKEKMEEQGPLSDEAKATLEELKAMGDKVWITYIDTGDGSFIELFSDEGITEKYNWSLSQFDHIGYLHLSLEVDDIFSTYEEMKKHGVKIKNSPTLGIENAWQFWIEDPDGNSIEFMQYEENAWQKVGHNPDR